MLLRLIEARATTCCAHPERPPRARREDPRLGPGRGRARRLAAGVADRGGQAPRLAQGAGPPPASRRRTRRSRCSSRAPRAICSRPTRSSSSCALLVRGEPRRRRRRAGSVGDSARFDVFQLGEAVARRRHAARAAHARRAARPKARRRRWCCGRCCGSCAASNAEASGRSDPAAMRQRGWRSPRARRAGAAVRASCAPRRARGPHDQGRRARRRLGRNGAARHGVVRRCAAAADLRAESPEPSPSASSAAPSTPSTTGTCAPPSSCGQALALAEVRFLPTGNPPHREAPLAPRRAAPGDGAGGGRRRAGLRGRRSRDAPHRPFLLRGYADRTARRVSRALAVPAARHGCVPRAAGLASLARDLRAGARGGGASAGLEGADTGPAGRGHGGPRHRQRARAARLPPAAASTCMPSPSWRSPPPSCGS